MAEKRLVIRLAEEADVPTIRRLQASIIPKAFGNGIKGERFLARRCETEQWKNEKDAFILDLITSSRGAVHVAEVNGRIRGFAYTNFNEVAGNFVAERWRRKQIGSALLLQELNAMISWGYEDAWLGVGDFAIGPQRFYNKNGFRIASLDTIDHPPGHNGRATGTEFEVKDLKMEMPDIVSAREQLQVRLGLGALAFDDVIEVDLGSIHHIRLFVRHLVNKCRVALTEITCRYAPSLATASLGHASYRQMS